MWLRIHRSSSFLRAAGRSVCAGFVLSICYGVVLAQDQPDIQAAISGATYLHDHMREPDSFQLGVVYLKPNGKNHLPNICYTYKGKNGFGGYSAGQAVSKPRKGGYSIPIDPDEIHPGDFDKVDCNPKKAIDITDRIKEALAAK